MATFLSVKNSFPKDRSRERMSEKKTRGKTSRTGEDKFMKRPMTLTERNKDQYYYLEPLKKKKRKKNK